MSLNKTVGIPVSPAAAPDRAHPFVRHAKRRSLRETISDESRWSSALRCSTCPQLINDSRLMRTNDNGDGGQGGEQGWASRLLLRRRDIVMPLPSARFHGPHVLHSCRRRGEFLHNTQTSQGTFGCVLTVIRTVRLLWRLLWFNPLLWLP